MVGFNRRFSPFGQALKEFLADRNEPLYAHYRGQCWLAAAESLGSMTSKLAADASLVKAAILLISSLFW